MRSVFGIRTKVSKSSGMRGRGDTGLGPSNGYGWDWGFSFVPGLCPWLSDLILRLSCACTYVCVCACLWTGPGAFVLGRGSDGVAMLTKFCADLEWKHLNPFKRLWLLTLH